MFSLKYFSNLFSSFLYFSLSSGGSFFCEIFGHNSEYFLFISNHFSFPLSVSGTIAFIGHSGSQTPQSIPHLV